MRLCFEDSKQIWPKQILTSALPCCSATWTATGEPEDPCRFSAWLWSQAVLAVLQLATRTALRDAVHMLL